MKKIILATVALMMIFVLSAKAVTLLTVPQGGTGLGSVTAESYLKGAGTGALVPRTVSEVKTDLSLNNVENTALSTWAGTTNITTLGTIATGVWNGTSISDANVDNDITIDLATLATTANAGDAAVDFFGAGVDAVTDATTCTDIEGTGLSITTSTLNWSASGIAGHDSFSDFVANEHLDWTADLGATNIHSGNYTDNDTTYVSSDFTHDDLTGFVANEHLDWTSDLGATNIHAGNYTDTNTTYTAGTGLTLTTGAFSVNTSQNIATLSNLTTNGFITTSGGTGLLGIDTNTYLTGNQTITLSGDVSGSGTTALTVTVGADKILETHLKSVNAPTDEYCLTYETTTGDFEWQECIAGAGDITDVFDCSTGDCNTMTVGTSEYLTYGTGYIDANRFAGITTVDSTEFGYLNGLTAAIVQTGSASHDGFSDFVANEHLDWTSDLGATNIHAGNYTDNNTTYTAGRSLTLDGTTINADAETYTGKHKIAFETPTATDDFFFGEVATAQTFTSIYCKTLVGTVDLDISIAGTDINGTDITCNTTGVLDSSLGGDTAGAVGEEVKLLITSVASDPTYLMVQLNYTYND